VPRRQGPVHGQAHSVWTGWLCDQDRTGLSLGLGKLFGVLTMLTLCWERGKRRLLFVAPVVLLLGMLFLAHPGMTARVQAGAPGGDAATAQTCTICHATPGLKMQLASGEVLSATVDPQGFNKSAHGSVLQCTACHPEIAGYPHLARTVARPSARDVPFLMRTYTACGTCHQKEYTQYLGSAHAQALTVGKAEAAICSDCHGVHDIGQANPAEVGLALGPAVYNCAKCHAQEYDEYKNSVHGKELLQQGNLDVPSCVDCHGVHDMHKAKDSTSFRSQSLGMCSSCHANTALMTKYGLSPDILTTYIADFHGTTAQLFPVQSGQAPEQALCYDCHGVHAIASTVSVQGLALQDNLLKACQKCHPDANANFPAAWLGHHQPTPDNSALVFWIRGIYNVLITGTVLLLVGHISLDIGRVLLNTLHQRDHAHE
jgi:hypothetical protein